MQHNSNRLMLVISAGCFRDSVAAPSERLLDTAPAELFSLSPERGCGLNHSRSKHDILMAPFTADRCCHLQLAGPAIG
jgi:hypothetical protein